ncbi:hypothetical protein QTH89_07205 [Variovorax sp. J22G21]|uniref:hypothetical protein n=1 Tax=Variovorax fucosicus TaxID=3053517 RepID=UPI0025761E2D|nr:MULTISPECIES: hypothetical protein [unclassified Variovorax]MDM0042386.1 hypothetical protein [Variovorax sp. J22R193]MDM0060991.1 hypothetical protein [Variovorax sp. J22G21]
MPEPNPSPDRQLGRLCDLYMRSNRALVHVRQAYIEALGDHMCGGPAGPSDADLEMLELLSAAEARAKEAYLRCAMAAAAALVERAGRAPDAGGSR